MSRTALALLAFVLLAGCSGLAPAAGGGGDTPTLTPVDVPEDRSQSVPALVTDNSTRLLDRHVARLDGARYGVTAFHTRTVAKNQTNHAYSAAVAPDGRYTATLSRYSGFDETRNQTALHYFDDGEWVYLHYQRDVARETVAERYYRYDATDLEPFDFDRDRQLRALFGATDLRVANQRTDEGHYRIYAPEPYTVRHLPTRAGTVDVATVQRLYAVVRPDGVVVRYRFRYEGRLDGREASGNLRVELRNLGTQQVEAPYWYDTARATTTPPGTATTRTANDTRTATDSRER